MSFRSMNWTKLNIYLGTSLYHSHFRANFAQLLLASSETFIHWLVMRKTMYNAFFILTFWPNLTGKWAWPRSRQLRIWGFQNLDKNWAHWMEPSGSTVISNLSFLNLLKGCPALKFSLTNCRDHCSLFNLEKKQIITIPQISYPQSIDNISWCPM